MPIGIAAGIAANQCPWAEYGSVSSVETMLGAKWAAPVGSHTEELSEAYFTGMVEQLCRHPAANKASDVKIVHTAMHGVGTKWTLRAFEAFGLPPPAVVPQQREPDPTFPTVAFPNPEEGAGALKLAYATAEEVGASLVLANDPDADRLAVAERLPSGEWRTFSGNEIGVLLADWQWSQFKSNGNGKRRAPPRAAMLSSAVSSRMVAALARAEGFHWEETLTGFKWLCSRSAELRATGVEVLLCYEEAIGFCLGSLVNDKDGVSASAVFGEMASFLKRENGRSISEHMDALYVKYGQFVQNNGYVICRHPPTTTALFGRIRNEGRYWLLLNGKRVCGIRDLTTGVDTDAADGRATLPVSTSSQMITFSFADGAVATLRGSGTEPKIKWYAEMCGEDRQETTAQLQRLVDALVNDMLQPEANGLERRKA